MGFEPIDVPKMPCKFISFGYNTDVDVLPSIQRRWHLGKRGFFMRSNIDVPKELETRLRCLMNILHSSNLPANVQYDEKFLRSILQERDECYALFRKAIN